MTDEYRCNQIHILNAPTDLTHGVNKEYLNTEIGKDLSIVKYEFVYDNGVPSGLNNYPLWSHKGQFNSIIAPGDGYLIKAQVRLGAAITTGTMNFNYRLTRGVNPPTLIVPDSYDLRINLVAIDDYGLTKIPVDDRYEAEENDKWEVVVTTSGDFVMPVVAMEFLLFVLITRDHT